MGTAAGWFVEEGSDEGVALTTQAGIIFTQSKENNAEQLEEAESPFWDSEMEVLDAIVEILKGEHESKKAYEESRKVEETTLADELAAELDIRKPNQKQIDEIYKWAVQTVERKTEETEPSKPTTEPVFDTFEPTLEERTKSVLMEIESFYDGVQTYDEYLKAHEKATEYQSEIPLDIYGEISLEQINDIAAEALESIEHVKDSPMGVGSKYLTKDAQPIIITGETKNAWKYRYLHENKIRKVEKADVESLIEFPLSEEYKGKRAMKKPTKQQSNAGKKSIRDLTDQASMTSALAKSKKISTADANKEFFDDLNSCNN
jgi:hypothetical protein